MSIKRRDSSPTKTRGVQLVSPGEYRVRGYFVDPKTGRSRELVRIVKARSVAEAAAMRVDMLRGRTSGGPHTERQRLSTYVASWLRLKAPKLKPSTRKTYAERLQHALGVLGDHFVDALTPVDVGAYRDAQTGDSPATVNGRLRTLRTVLRDAVIDLRLPVDPTLRVEFLRENTVTDDASAASLTASELKRVLAALKKTGPQWYPLVLTLALTGLRFGEATALRWEDIDFGSGTITVARAQWKQRLDTTKTGRRRVVVLARELRDVLLGHQRRQLAQQWPGFDTGFVFLSSTGTLLFNSVLTKPVRAAMKEAKVSRPSFSAAHGFRHTFNDLVRQVAEGEVVRALTGHSTEEMTTHYSHVRIEEKRAAVTKVGRLLRLASG